MRKFAGAIKRSPLNMRTTKQLRSRIEGAAKLSGRSLIQEVEYRIEQSFRDDDIVQRILVAVGKA